MTEIYSRLITYKRLCPSTSAVMLHYIIQCLWGLKETTIYHPSLKCPYYVTDDVEFVSSAHAEQGVSGDYIDGLRRR